MLLIKIFLSVQIFFLFFFTKKENLVKPATPLLLGLGAVMLRKGK